MRVEWGDGNVMLEVSETVSPYHFRGWFFSSTAPARVRVVNPIKPDANWLGFLNPLPLNAAVKSAAYSGIFQLT